MEVRSDGSGSHDAFRHSRPRLTSTRGPARWALPPALLGKGGTGLVALLTINGVSRIPTAVVIGTAVLVAVGLLLPAAGLLKLRRTINHDRSAARYGLLLQALGLIGLLSAPS
jgi:hypothetical protein